MRKVTVSMICGIIIGMIISNISDNFTVKLPPSDIVVNIPPVATQVEHSDPFDQQIAPGLQIVEVPPPLDMNGRVPYQCYFNGQHIKLPKDVVQQIVAKHGNPSDNDPNFNVHNFIGNLKMIDLPVGSNVPTSPFPVAGRVR
jgi:hypothetical protein